MDFLSEFVASSTANNTPAVNKQRQTPRPPPPVPQTEVPQPTDKVTPRPDPDFSVPQSQIAQPVNEPTTPQPGGTTSPVDKAISQAIADRRVPDAALMTELARAGHPISDATFEFADEYALQQASMCKGARGDIVAFCSDIIRSVLESTRLHRAVITDEFVNNLKLRGVDVNPLRQEQNQQYREMKEYTQAMQEGAILNRDELQFVHDARQFHAKRRTSLGSSLSDRVSLTAYEAADKTYINPTKAERMRWILVQRLRASAPGIDPYTIQSNTGWLWGTITLRIDCQTCTECTAPSSCEKCANCTAPPPPPPCENCTTRPPMPRRPPPPVAPTVEYSSTPLTPASDDDEKQASIVAHTVSQLGHMSRQDAERHASTLKSVTLLNPYHVVTPTRQTSPTGRMLNFINEHLIPTTVQSRRQIRTHVTELMKLFNAISGKSNSSNCDAIVGAWNKVVKSNYTLTIEQTVSPVSEIVRFYREWVASVEQGSGNPLAFHPSTVLAAAAVFYDAKAAPPFELDESTWGDISSFLGYNAPPVETVSVQSLSVLNVLHEAMLVLDYAIDKQDSAARAFVQKCILPAQALETIKKRITIRANPKNANVYPTVFSHPYLSSQNDVTDPMWNLLERFGIPGSIPTLRDVYDMLFLFHFFFLLIFMSVTIQDRSRPCCNGHCCGCRVRAA